MADDKTTSAQNPVTEAVTQTQSRATSQTIAAEAQTEPQPMAALDLGGPVPLNASIDTTGLPERAETPVPEVPVDLKRDNPELYAAYIKHIQAGYASNDRVFAQVLSAFLRSHYSSLVMYWILFAVGVLLFVVAVALALFQGQVIGGAAFAGLSVVSFLLYFVSRPTQAVEENLIYIAWLGVVYNSYWTHLAWATERGTAQNELDKATSDVVQQMNALLDRHAQSVKDRPSFKETIVG